MLLTNKKSRKIRNIFSLIIPLSHNIFLISIMIIAYVIIVFGEVGLDYISLSLAVLISKIVLITFIVIVLFVFYIRETRQYMSRFNDQRQVRYYAWSFQSKNVTSYFKWLWCLLPFLALPLYYLMNYSLLVINFDTDWFSSQIFLTITESNEEIVKATSMWMRERVFYLAFSTTFSLIFLISTISVILVSIFTIALNKLLIRLPVEVLLTLEKKLRGESQEDACDFDENLTIYQEYLNTIVKKCNDYFYLKIKLKQIARLKIVKIHTNPPRMNV